MEKEDRINKIDDDEMGGEDMEFDDEEKFKFNQDITRLEDNDKTKYAYLKFRQNEMTLKRYQASRDSKIEYTKVQKFISTNYNFNASELTSTIIASICKIYLGELVEEAREMMTQKGKEGNQTPQYLNLAYSKLSRKKKLGVFKNEVNKMFK